MGALFVQGKHFLTTFNRDEYIENTFHMTTKHGAEESNRCVNVAKNMCRITFGITKSNGLVRRHKKAL